MILTESLKPTVSGPGRAENTYGIALGKKGMGKTTYVRQVVHAGRLRGRSLTFFDPTTKNADMGNVVRSAAAWFSLVRHALKSRKPFASVVQLGFGHSQESYNKFWELIYETGNMDVVLDEVHLMASASRIHPDLESLVRMGRNRQINIYATTQTPPGVHGVIKANADWVVAFAQRKRSYAEVVNDEFGFDLPNGVELLLKLPKFHYLRADNAGRVTRGVVKL